MDEESIADGHLLGKYLKPDLLIIDNMGHLIGDVPAAGAILDRLLQGAVNHPLQRAPLPPAQQRHQAGRGNR